MKSNKDNDDTIKYSYSDPQLEIIEVYTERGFAQSGTLPGDINWDEIE